MHICTNYCLEISTYIQETLGNHVMAYKRGKRMQLRTKPRTKDPNFRINLMQITRIQYEQVIHSINEKRRVANHRRKERRRGYRK